MPLRRTGKHRTLCWIGLAFSVLLLVAWLASLNCLVDYNGGRLWGNLSSGVLSFTVAAQPMMHAYGWRVPFDAPDAVSAEHFGFSWPDGSYQSHPTMGYWRLSLPLWIPILVIGTGTLVLASRGRPHVPESQCKHCLAEDAALRRGRCAECSRTFIFAALVLGIGVICSIRALSFLVNGPAVVVLGWFVAFGYFSFVPSFLRWRHRRRWKAMAIGYCRRCGYDLTGNVSGICPECGTPCRLGLGAASSPASEGG